MKVAILSDIHGNLPALEVVDKDLAYQRPDAIYCLGDTVGYGPYPGECVDWVREKANIALQGNHDHAMYDDDILRYFNPPAMLAMGYTRDRLTPYQREFLQGLPVVMAIKMLNLTLVHGTFTNPWAWKYIQNEGTAYDELLACPTQFLFYGHTHQPEIYTMGQGLRTDLHPGVPLGWQSLSTTYQHALNVGSVGQPRDRDPRACYMTVEVYKRRFKVQYHRIAYDIPRMFQAVCLAGLEGHLSRRLWQGR